jgi:protein TonB
MATARGTRLLGLLALALAASSVRADDSTTISAHGDALARATSAQALVRPMPANPPNTPIAPKPKEPQAIPAPSPAPSPIAVVPPMAPAPSPAQAPKVAAAAPEAPAAPPPAAPAPASNGPSRTWLIVLGAAAAVGLFLWERRKPD